jgi:hypothetical protein
MLSFFELIYYYLLFLVSLFLVYLLGKFILSFYAIAKDFKLKIFLSMLIGITTTSLGYSIFKTSGITFQLGLVPLVIYLGYYFRKYVIRFTIDFKEIKKEGIVLLICGSIIYFYQSSFYFDYISFTVKQLFTDNYIYAQTSDSLQYYGSENFNFGANHFFEEIKNERTPYRYGDLWLSAFFINFTKLSSVFCFYCITIPILISSLMIGLFELLKTSNSTVFSRYTVSFILLFVSIFFIPYLNLINDLKYVSEPSLMGSFQQKLGLTSLVSFLAIYLWSKNRKVSLVLLASLPVFYISYLPSVWGGIILFTLFEIFRSKFSFRKSKFYFQLFLVIIGLIIFFFMFYHFYGQTFATITNPNLSETPILKRLPNELINNSSGSKSLKIIILEFIRFSIPNIFIYLKGSIGHLLIGTLFFIPFLFFVPLNFKKNRSLILFYFFIFCSGLFGLVLNDGNGDNYQFYTNNLILISLTLIIAIIEKINQIEKLLKSPKIIVLLICIILFNLIPIISFKSKIGSKAIDKDFFIRVSQEIKSDHLVQILFFINDDGFGEGFYNWVGRNDLYPLQQLSSQRIEFNLGNPEVYLKNNTLIKSDKQFYEYWSVLNYWRKKTGKLPVEDFVSSYKINYLYLDSKVSIPSGLKSKIKRIIESKDGRKFITIY